MRRILSAKTLKTLNNRPNPMFVKNCCDFVGIVNFLLRKCHAVRLPPASFPSLLSKIAFFGYGEAGRRLRFASG